MKRMISLFLTVMLLIGSICSAKAMEDTRWVCSQCGRTNEASYAFCPSCGAQRMEVSADKTEQDNVDSSDAQTDASKGKETSQGTESSSDILSLYYKNAVIGGFSSWRLGKNGINHYLSIVTRLKDGLEETSCLAVAVYDLYENGLVIWGDSGLLSEGCEYEWQCQGRSYPVVISSSKAAAGLIAFKLKEDDDLEVIDGLRISYAACPYFRLDEDEGNLSLVYFGVDEPNKRLVAKTQSAKGVGFEDHTTYQTIALADYEDYADNDYEYQEEIEEASSLWGSGICGALINEDGSICGIHVADIGIVSLYNVANSTRQSIPNPTDVFGVSLLRTEDLGEITGSVYELPEGYESSQAIYEEYIAALMDEGIPFWFDMLDEKDYVVVLDAYGLEEENINAVLFAIKDECLVLLKRSDSDAESNPWQDRSPWDLLESMGWDLEIYRYSTVWSLE